MNGISRLVCYCLGFSISFSTGVSEATNPVVWEQISQRDFQRGDPVNVAVTSSGQLRLAPQTDAIFETSEPLLWSLATDSKGTIYAASGNDGKLFRITGSGEGSLHFDADELEIHSLAVGSDDYVFAATFPNGKIYRISPSGDAEVYFSPSGSTSSSDSSSVGYIWSLALDRSGLLYAGTGDQGKIFRIAGQGRGEVFAETAEAHVVSLAFAPSGDLIAGTDPNGRVYSVSPSGDLSVLYDSPFPEIRAIHVGPDGAIYAGAVNESRGTQGRPAVPGRQIPGSSGARPVQNGVAVLEVTAAPPNAPNRAVQVRGGRPRGGMVYRIQPDGEVQEWWQSTEDESFSLAVNPAGRLLVGTGPRGIVYEVSGRGQSTSLVRLRESQITALVSTSDGRTVIGSSNLGNVYRMNGTPEKEGTFDSQVKDAGMKSTWGQISWDANVPDGTSAKLYSRSGNTDTPDGTWSDWNGPYSRQSGESVDSPPARFIQWRAVLATRNSETPVIRSVSLAYLPRNVAPVLNSVTVYEPGVFIRENGNPEVELADLPPKVALRVRGRSDGGQRSSGQVGTPSYRKGMRTVVINAKDGNDDRLAYSVLFRGKGEQSWKPLQEDLDRPAYSWDSETFPDGWYTLKVVVGDTPSNPPAAALYSEMESAPFLIDNTSPQIKALSNSSGKVSFSVEDNASAVYRVEYAIDGGDWWVLYPDDGVADSPEETFTLSVPRLDPGEHIVAVRAKDTANNTGTAKKLVLVP